MSGLHELEAALTSLPKEQLVRKIIQIAEEDERFRNGLLLKYVKGNRSQQLQSCKKLVDAIINKYTGRDHYISYRETADFTRDMLGVLENATEAQDDELALEIALLVLEEGMRAFGYADDSDGDIGMLVEETLTKIQEMADELDEQDIFARESFFERLLAMCKSTVFEEWEDFRMTLLRISTQFTNVEKHREQLKGIIEQRISFNGANEQKKYANEALYKLLFHLLEEHGSAEETDRFVQEHLQYPYFRELAIQRSMDRMDYQRAIALAEEGERQDQKLPGLLSKWRKARYNAYKILSLKHEQELLAKELLLDGDYSYYDDLELLFEGDKETFYRSIVTELKASKNWRARAVYQKLIADKNDKVEMMAYVEANPSEIEGYAARLFADYREGVERIYSERIYHAAGSAQNRNEYRRVCEMLKRYKHVVGKESQAAIILQLKAQYYKRPAFLDELAGLS